MSFFTLLALILAVVLIVYLALAMLFPERL
ncbi:MAG TPA: potassium-transporting ATPase subunit F [Terracidiphilus sp.]|nr:potassium-transporting ATPase subunit F [Terracidiphilus sp.]